MKIRFALACLALLACFSLTLRAQEPQFRPPILIEHATVIPAPGQLLENCSVLLRGDRIAAVGTDIAAPEYAEVIDGSDLFIYAGFIDAASRKGITKARRDASELSRAQDDMPDLRQGCVPYMPFADRTGVRPEFRARELYDPAGAGLDGWRGAGFTSAQVIPEIGILSGSGAVLQLGKRPLRDSVLVEDFAHTAGYATGEKRGWENSDYPGTMMGCMAQFRQALMDARWYRDMQAYCAAHPDYSPRPPSDPALEALFPVLDGELPLMFLADDDHAILRSLKLSDEFGLRPGIIGGTFAWRVVDVLKQRNLPLVISVNFPDEPYPERKVKQPESGGDKPKADKGKGKRGPKRRNADAAPDAASNADGDTPAPKPEAAAGPDEDDEAWEKKNFEPMETRDERRRQWAERVRNLAELEKAGVRFAVGSWDLKKPDELLTNLRKAVEHGLTPEGALRAITTEPAAMFGLTGQLGTVETGKLANLTILTKPMQDEEAKIAYVFVEGDRFEFPASKKKKKDGEKKNDEEKSSGENAPESTDAPDPETAAQDEPADDTPVDTEPVAEAEQPEEQWPVFASETEADREPAVKTGGNLLIQHATLLTVTQGTLTDTDLLVLDGRIAKIGKGLTAPDGVWTVDLTGHYVMPGIIDPHSHIGTTGGLNEWTMSITPEVRVKDIVDSRSLRFQRALAGGVTCMHTMHGSANTIGGQNAVLRCRYLARPDDMIWWDAPQTVKFALGENVTHANSDNKRGSRYPISRMGVEDTLREAFRQATVYKKSLQAWERERAAGNTPPPFRRDLRLDALMNIMNGDIWVHCHCYRADEILRLLSVAEDFGFRIAVLQHVLEAYRIMPEILRHGAACSTFSDWWSYKIEAVNAVPHNAGMCLRHGISTTVNSDDPEMIRHMNLEAAKSVRFGGLDSDEALRMITLEGARQLGIDRWVGSLEVGKEADLAVFNGHPLDTFSRCALTAVRGELYFLHPDLLKNALPTVNAGKAEFEPAPAILSVPLSASGKYAIVNATVHPVSGPAFENGTVLIDSGNILALGEGLSAGPEYEHIEARGLHVYPGLIDAGTGLGLRGIGSIEATNDFREIGKYNPQLRAASAVDPHAMHIEVTRAEGVTTALTFPRGGALPGQACLIRLDGWSVDQMLVRDEVALVCSVPSLPVKFTEAQEPDEHDEEEAAGQGGDKAHYKQLNDLREYFAEARRYDKARAANAEGIEYNGRLEALRPYVRGEKPVMFVASSYKEILDTIRFAEKESLTPILYGGDQAWKLADTLAEKNIPVLYTGAFGYPGSQFDPWDAYYKGAATLAAAGVKFCFATGSSDLSKQLPLNAGISVAYGLDEDRALRGMTLDAAEILGIGDVTGSLEPGKSADLILTTGNPMQATSKVLAEFIAGRPVTLDSIHERNAKKFAERPEPSLPPANTLVGPPRMEAVEVK